MEGRLHLVPCDLRSRFENLRQFLEPAVQHAKERQRGVVLLHLPEAAVQGCGLEELRERRGGATYIALDTDATCGSVHVIEPSSAPAAAVALHRLATELTYACTDFKALNPSLDPLSDWLRPDQGSEQRVHSRRAAQGMGGVQVALACVLAYTCRGGVLRRHLWMGAQLSTARAHKLVFPTPNNPLQAAAVKHNVYHAPAPPPT